jgi:hypothetical protein
MGFSTPSLSSYTTSALIALSFEARYKRNGMPGMGALTVGKLAMTRWSCWKVYWHSSVHSYLTPFFNNEVNAVVTIAKLGMNLRI